MKPLLRLRRTECDFSTCHAIVFTSEKAEEEKRIKHHPCTAAQHMVCVMMRHNNTNKNNKHKKKTTQEGVAMYMNISNKKNSKQKSVVRSSSLHTLKHTACAHSSFIILMPEQTKIKTSAWNLFAERNAACRERMREYEYIAPPCTTHMHVHTCFRLNGFIA